MTDTSDRKRRTADAFDEGATAYVDSEVHQRGDDLEQIATWLADRTTVVDVATGAGHTAGAIAMHGDNVRVVATDVAPAMIRTATDSFPSLIGVLADAERLPFTAAAVDGLACRIAAHHFPNPEAFVAESARILEPGGLFAFEDNIAPDDPDLDAFLNRVERLRDPTHHRSHTEATWRTWLEDAGFQIVESFVIQKTIQYESWIEQLGTSEENQRKLEELFTDPPEGAAELFDIQCEDGIPQSFSNLKLVLLARRLE